MSDHNHHDFVSPEPEIGRDTNIDAEISQAQEYWEKDYKPETKPEPLMVTCLFDGPAHSGVHEWVPKECVCIVEAAAPEAKLEPPMHKLTLRYEPRFSRIDVKANEGILSYPCLETCNDKSHNGGPQSHSGRNVFIYAQCSCGWENLVGDHIYETSAKLEARLQFLQHQIDLRAQPASQPGEFMSAEERDRRYNSFREGYHDVYVDPKDAWDAGYKAGAEAYHRAALDHERRSK